MLGRSLALVVALCAFAAPAAFAGEPAAGVPWTSDPAAAAQAAKKEGKVVLVYLFTTDCKHCAKFKAETLKDPAVLEALGRVVPLEGDARSKDAGAKAFVEDIVRRVRASGEKIQGVPSVVVTDAEWNVLAFLSGFQEPGTLVDEVARVAGANDVHREIAPRIASGEATPAETGRFLEACFELKKTAALRDLGPKFIETPKTDRHAQVAYLLSRTYDPDEAPFAVYRQKALEWDADNARGIHDAVVADDVVRLVRSVKSPADKAPKVSRAKKTLEERIFLGKPPLHPEKGQTLYWVLFQLLAETGPVDLKRAKEVLKEGVALAPETRLAKTMAKRLKDLGG